MTNKTVNYRYGTGNPVEPNGSIDVRDGIDNLQSLDVFMNATEDLYNQRDGDIVKTVSGMVNEFDYLISGMNEEFDSQMTVMNSEFDQQIQNMGYTRIGTFAVGATLKNTRQTLLWEVSSGGDGQEYGWSGTFPKVVPPGSTPASTGGIAVGAWMSRFDPDLHTALVSFSGDIVEPASWADIPKHSDPEIGAALDYQTEALAARSELLKFNADRSFVVSGDAGVKYMAHRGLSAVAPENTLPAYEAAGRAGFWGAECDIQLTADGVWVVIHDDTVDRTTNGTGAVSSLTLAQIKALDAGSKFHPYYAGTKIPTLTEFLVVCRKYRMTPMIEFKQAGATNAQIEAAIDLCSSIIPDLQFSFIGNGEAAVQQIRDVNPNVSVELLAGVYSAEMVDACVRTGCNWLAMQYANPFPDVSYAKEKGVNLTVWTVDDPDQTKICIANGARKITTNFTNLF